MALTEEQKQVQLSEMKAIIEQYGFAISSIPGDETGPGYAYTVGLTMYKMPELIWAGDHNVETVRDTLNSLVMGWMRRSPAFSLGLASGHLEREDETPVDLKVVDAKHKEKCFQHCAWVNEMYGGLASFAQVFWPDLQGNYPDTFMYDQQNQPQEVF
jgi:hypothetical protein